MDQRPDEGRGSAFQKKGKKLDRSVHIFAYTYLIVMAYIENVTYLMV